MPKERKGRKIEKIVRENIPVRDAEYIPSLVIALEEYLADVLQSILMTVETAIKQKGGKKQ